MHNIGHNLNEDMANEDNTILKVTGKWFIGAQKQHFHICQVEYFSCHGMVMFIDESQI